MSVYSEALNPHTDRRLSELEATDLAIDVWAAAEILAPDLDPGLSRGADLDYQDKYSAKIKISYPSEGPEGYQSPILVLKIEELLEGEARDWALALIEAATNQVNEDESHKPTAPDLLGYRLSTAEYVATVREQLQIWKSSTYTYAAGQAEPIIVREVVPRNGWVAGPSVRWGNAGLADPESPPALHLSDAGQIRQSLALLCPANPPLQA